MNPLLLSFRDTGNKTPLQSSMAFADKPQEDKDSSDSSDMTPLLNGSSSTVDGKSGPALGASMCFLSERL